MAISTTKATIQMRKGREEDFAPDQMTSGEWAVSTDTRKVWMCFTPGLVLRMATYEAFEQDMQEIQSILLECQDIQAAVKKFEQLAEQHKNKAEQYSEISKSWAIGEGGVRDDESENNSKYFSEKSKVYSDISKMYLGKVEQAADEAIGKLDEATKENVPGFQMDLSTGHLMYEGGRFMFQVNKEGHLEWGLSV